MKPKDKQKVRAKTKDKSLPTLLHELDDIFSQFIRYRDMKDGKIKCFTCGDSIRYNEAQCMHYIDRDHMPVRYNEMNCNAGCETCNCFDDMHKYKYEQAMLFKYGEDELEKLQWKSKGLQKFMRYEVEELITHYKSMVSELKKV